MSVLSEKIRQALYQKLNVPSVVGAGLATGVYHKKAPERSRLPYLIFARQAVGTLQGTFRGFLLESDLWLIKAITDENSSATKEPETLGEDILAAAETSIGGGIAITGGAIESVGRERDIPGYVEQQSDVTVYHQGFLLRVKASISEG